VSEETPARGVRAELIEARARQQIALDEVAGLDREHRRVRMDALDARWEAADGLGPVPGAHAFDAAEDRGDAVATERALLVAARSVGRREAAHSSTESGATAGRPSTAAPGRTALRVLLDDLQAAGRPIPVLLPDERTLLEARAETDPAGFDRAVADVRSRARIESARLRLLFDLEHLATRLPDGLADELSAAATALGEDPDPAARILDLRGRMLDALTAPRKG